MEKISYVLLIAVLAMACSLFCHFCQISIFFRNLMTTRGWCVGIDEISVFPMVICEVKYLHPFVSNYGALHMHAYYLKPKQNKFSFADDNKWIVNVNLIDT